MSDSMRHRDKCARCGQWREDCGQDQVCRACHLEAECERLRELLRQSADEANRAGSELFRVTGERDRLREENDDLRARKEDAETRLLVALANGDRLRGELDAVSAQRDAADKAELDGRAQCARLREELAERERVARRIFSLITHCGLMIEHAPEWLLKEQT